MKSTAKYGNVVTTIQNPTKALLKLTLLALEKGEKLFVIGDKKTPTEFNLPGAVYFGPSEQELLEYKVVSNLPWNSYTRKMIGYLEAVKQGCEYIRETDDDNFPLESYFIDFPESIVCRYPEFSDSWINPYRYFSDEYIWPRGYPIELIVKDRENHHSGSAKFTEKVVNKIGVIQGLANGAPDVDAIFRLIQSNAGDFIFNNETPLVIPSGTFAPFNSQVTTWDGALLPLMYLPQTCTFRMTDIWRSLIASHLLQKSSYSLIFTQAGAFQERNDHDLLRDFSDEVPGYTGNALLAETIRSVPITGEFSQLASDLKLIYGALVEKEFLKDHELLCLEAWLADCKAIQGAL